MKPWTVEKQNAVRSALCRQAKKIQKQSGAGAVYVLAFFPEGDRAYIGEGFAGEGPRLTDLLRQMVQAHELADAGHEGFLQ